MARITSSSKGCTTPGGAFSQHTASLRQIFRTWTLKNEAGHWLAICLEPKGHREGGLRKGGSRGAPGTPAHFNHSSSTGSVSWVLSSSSKQRFLLEQLTFFKSPLLPLSC